MVREEKGEGMEEDEGNEEGLFRETGWGRKRESGEESGSQIRKGHDET
jgi:hypothetical protein